MTSVAVLLATLIAWAAFGVNTAIIVKAQSGVRSSLMGVSVGSDSFHFKWGAVMPLSLVAAVSLAFLVPQVGTSAKMKVLLSVALVISALSFFLGNNPPSYHHSYGTGSKKEMRQGSTTSY
jgi:hypothetical protein